MKQRFEREGGAWWEITIGFGRAQRARAASYKALPDSMKRAVVTDPEITPEALFAKASTQERVDHHRTIARDYAIIALSDAYDWNQATTTPEDYVDKFLPEDVGDDIVFAVAQYLATVGVTTDEKKT